GELMRAALCQIPPAVFFDHRSNLDPVLLKYSGLGDDVLSNQVSLRHGRSSRTGQKPITDRPMGSAKANAFLKGPASARGHAGPPAVCVFRDSVFGLWFLAGRSLSLARCRNGPCSRARGNDGGCPPTDYETGHDVAERATFLGLSPPLGHEVQVIQ